MLQRYFLMALAILSVIPVPGKQKADILIKGGTVYDGSGREPVTADVVVTGEKIVFVGDASRKFKADKVIDAAGYIVCPGFIDPHTHQEATLLKKKSDENYLRMGVTMVFTGMCGGSRYPLSKYFATLEEQGIGINTASFTGHNTLRARAMGSIAKPAGEAEVAKMKKDFAADLEAGSFGLSGGLFYVPGCFAEISEVYEIARVMAPYGGVYTTHVRNENKDGIGLQASIAEAISVGRHAGVSVNISHIKCLGKTVWGQSGAVISMIEKARAEGMQVTADQYPYQASSTSITSALTPSWSRDGGNAGLRRNMDNPDFLSRLRPAVGDLIYERGEAETILFTDGEYKGKTLKEVAGQLGLSPVETVLAIVRKSSPGIATFVMCEEDIENYMKQPWVMNCSDGNALGGHPRAAGSTVEKIRKYVMERKVLTIGEMIRRSTGLVAETYGLKDRGVIAEGSYADIIVFKPEEISANATYKHPSRMATGFRYVFVNGTAAVENDVYTGSLTGKVIRKNAQ